jgi:hypothetical protein
VGFGKRASERALHEVGVTDLGRRSGKCCGDLRVEDGSHGADHGVQHLEILAAGMHDFDAGGELQGSRERREVLQTQRIDARRPRVARHLDQTQFGAIGALAQELRVDPKGLRRAQLGGGCGELLVSRDDRRQRVQR